MKGRVEGQTYVDVHLILLSRVYLKKISSRGLLSFYREEDNKKVD